MPIIAAETTTRIWIIFFKSHWILFILTMLTPVISEYYESIVWSTLNPKFHFFKDDFNDNKAFFTKAISPQSNIIMVCPNAALILTTVSKQPITDNLYENIWMVNRDDFYSCTINRISRDSRLLHLCNQPDKLNYYNVNITKVFSTLGYKPKQEESRNIYLIATSNGSKESLNQTSGGHCINEKDGISMRMKFTICESKSSDPSCKIPSSSNITKNTGSSMHWLEVLAICLGVALAISVLINIIFLLCLYVRRNKRTGSNRTKKTSQEPMKSLIVEPPNKKKHGRVSAAL